MYTKKYLIKAEDFSQKRNENIVIMTEETDFYTTNQFNIPVTVKKKPGQFESTITFDKDSNLYLKNDSTLTITSTVTQLDDVTIKPYLVSAPSFVTISDYVITIKPTTSITGNYTIVVGLTDGTYEKPDVKTFNLLVYSSTSAALSVKKSKYCGVYTAGTTVSFQLYITGGIPPYNITATNKPQYSTISNNNTSSTTINISIKYDSECAFEETYKVTDAIGQTAYTKKIGLLFYTSAAPIIWCDSMSWYSNTSGNAVFHDGSVSYSLNYSSGNYTTSNLNKYKADAWLVYSYESSSAYGYAIARIYYSKTYKNRIMTFGQKDT